MNTINKHYFIMLLISFFGLSSEIQSYDNVCSSKKECDKIERNRNQVIHGIEDDLKDTRWNIEDYGATQATHEKLDNLDTTIENLCIACPADQKTKCNTNQNRLHRKLNNAVRLADRHTRKKMKKNEMNAQNVKIQEQTPGLARWS